MSITYRRHEKFQDSILIRDFTGKVNVHEIIQSWETLLEKQLITPQTIGVMNNLVDCDLEMDMGSFNILLEYLKEHKALAQLKLAVICNDPKTIVFPALGEHKESDLTIKPFSSEKAALKWITE